LARAFTGDYLYYVRDMEGCNYKLSRAGFKSLSLFDSSSSSSFYPYRNDLLRD
jgi:hypothetical protein